MLIPAVVLIIMDIAGKRRSAAPAPFIARRSCSTRALPGSRLVASMVEAMSARRDIGPAAASEDARPRTGAAAAPRQLFGAMTVPEPAERRLAAMSWMMRTTRDEHFHPARPLVINDGPPGFRAPWELGRSRAG